MDNIVSTTSAKIILIQQKGIKMKDEIQFKIVKISTEYQNITLKGVLSYWSKDYTIYLKEPFEASEGFHLMYAIPMRYVTSEEDPREGFRDINLLEKVDETLIRLYNAGPNAAKNDDTLENNKEERK